MRRRGVPAPLITPSITCTQRRRYGVVFGCAGPSYPTNVDTHHQTPPAITTSQIVFSMAFR